MDRQDEIEEELEEIAEFILTDEEMIIIMKGLDLYGYSLMLSNNTQEIMKTREVMLKIVSHLPRAGLNS